MQRMGMRVLASGLLLAGWMSPGVGRAEAWAVLSPAVSKPLPEIQAAGLTDVLEQGWAHTTPLPGLELQQVLKLAKPLEEAATVWKQAAQEKSCSVTTTDMEARLAALNQGRTLLMSAVAGLDAQARVEAVHRVGLLLGQCKGGGMVALVVGQALQNSAVAAAQWLWVQRGLDAAGRKTLLAVPLLGREDVVHALVDEKARSASELQGMETPPAGFDAKATRALMDQLHDVMVAQVKNNTAPSLDALRAAVKAKDPRADQDVLALLKKQRAKTELTPEEQKALDAQPNLPGRLYAFSVVGGMAPNVESTLRSLDALKARRKALAERAAPK